MDRVVVFVRWPEPGKAKTRLIPALGPRGASSLHGKMAERSISSMRRGVVVTGSSLEIRSTGGAPELFRRWLGDDLSVVDQGEGDLGARMALSVVDALRDGVEKVMIVGTDCPDLDPSFVTGVLELLDDSPVVMGPASDGGYYCLGIDLASVGDRAAELFRGIPWSSSRTGQATVEKARSMGLETARLPVLSDVDRPEDLSVWKRARRRISVIVPTLNERKGISRSLKSAMSARDVEVVVSDGGSTDGTIEIAKRCGAKVIASPRGRAVQMDRGAMAASGEILLFLHGDSVLPIGYGGAVRRVLTDGKVSLGAFSLQIGLDGELEDGKFKASLERIAFWANVRSRVLSLPYGDQGFFMDRAGFLRMGGFPHMSLLEDVFLARAAARVGEVRILPDAVRTSARRWRRLGVARTSLRNSMIMLAWAVGVSPSRLARWYRSGISAKGGVS